MFNRVLVVCVGNICRSPIGKVLLKRYSPHLIIDSAGVSALVGKPADSAAIKVCKQHSLNLNGHEAKQLTTCLCRDYDLILVMEKKHIESVTEIAPEARGKTMLFSHWLENDDLDIPDPYKKSQEAFDFVFEKIDKSAAAWSRKL